MLDSKGNITDLAPRMGEMPVDGDAKKWVKGDTDGRKDACWSITFSVAFGTCVHRVQRLRYQAVGSDGHKTTIRCFSGLALGVG